MSLPGWAPSFCAGETGRQRRWHVISWPGPWLSSGLRGQRPRTSKFRCVVVAHLNFLCRWPTIMYLPGCSPQRKAWKNIQPCSGYEICHQAEVFFQMLIGGRLATDHQSPDEDWHFRNENMSYLGLWPGWHTRRFHSSTRGCTGPSNDEPGLPRSAASLQCPFLRIAQSSWQCTHKPCKAVLRGSGYLVSG